MIEESTKLTTLKKGFGPKLMTCSSYGRLWDEEEESCLYLKISVIYGCLGIIAELLDELAEPSTLLEFWLSCSKFMASSLLATMFTLKRFSETGVRGSSLICGSVY